MIRALTFVVAAFAFAVPAFADDLTSLSAALATDSLGLICKFPMSAAVRADLKATERALAVKLGWNQDRLDDAVHKVRMSIANNQSKACSDATRATHERIVATIAARLPQVAAAGPKLVGIDALNAVLDNTLVGTMEHADIAMLIGKDGRVSMTTQPGHPGKWAFDGKKLCIGPSETKDECFVLEVTGQEGLMIGGKSGRQMTFVFKILAGNIRNL